MRVRVLTLFLGVAACADATSTGVDSAAVLGTPTTVPAFSVAWARDIGAAGNQSISDVFAASGRSFLVGRWTQTLDLHDGHAITANDGHAHPFVAAVDTNGQVIWRRGFMANGELIRVTGTAEENIVVSGTRSGEEDFGCGPLPQPGAFLAKYDGATGGCLWMRVWPSSQAFTIAAVRTEPNGDLAVAGAFAGSLNLGNGHVVVNASSSPQAFVARLDGKGRALWVRVLGDPSAGGTALIDALDLTTDVSGNLYLAGDFSGRVDLAGEIVDSGPAGRMSYLLALDGAGTRRWRYLDSEGVLSPVAIDTQAGRLAVIGEFHGSFPFAGATHGGDDARGVFVLDFSLDGHQRWAQIFAGSAVAGAGDVVVDSADRVNVVGTFSDGDLAIGTSFFDATAADTVRGFTAVLDPNDGSVLSANPLGDDGARILRTRLAFGPMGTRLMTAEVGGPSRLGATVVGSSDPVEPDAVYLGLTRGGTPPPPTETPAFNVSWVRSVSGPGNQHILDVAAGSTRSFLVGFGTKPFPDTQDGAFVASIDRNSETLWHHGFTPQVSFSIPVATAEDDLIVWVSTGGLQQDVGCGPIPTPAGAIVKYAGTNGQCQWMRIWSASDVYFITAIKMEPNGDIVVSGGFRGTVDLGNGIVIASAAVQAQEFVARLDHRGHGIWARVLGDPSAGSTTTIVTRGLATDASGNVYVAGQFGPRADLDGQVVDRGPNSFPTYLLAMDGDGAFRWLYLDDDGGMDPVGIDAHGGRLALFAHTRFSFTFGGWPYGAEGATVAVLDFDLDGHERWAHTFPGTASKTASAVVVDADGSVNALGLYSKGTLQLGSKTFIEDGEQDINIHENATPIWAFLAVLDADDGHVARAGVYGHDQAFIDLARMSFGPTGLQVMIADIVGMIQFGDVVVGQPAIVGEVDSAYVRLTP